MKMSKKVISGSLSAGEMRTYMLKNRTHLPDIGMIVIERL